MNPRKLAVAVLALTYREAAALLRVDRSTTLHRLIDAGLLQPVPWGSGQRISREQVEKLARVGFTLSPKSSRILARRRAAPAVGVGARIRAIEVK